MGRGNAHRPGARRSTAPASPPTRGAPPHPGREPGDPRAVQGALDRHLFDMLGAYCSPGRELPLASALRARIDRLAPGVALPERIRTASGIKLLSALERGADPEATVAHMRLDDGPWEGHPWADHYRALIGAVASAHGDDPDELWLSLGEGPKGAVDPRREPAREHAGALLRGTARAACHLDDLTAITLGSFGADTGLMPQDPCRAADEHLAEARVLALFAQACAPHPHLIQPGAMADHLRELTLLFDSPTPAHPHRGRNSRADDARPALALECAARISAAAAGGLLPAPDLFARILAWMIAPNPCLNRDSPADVIGAMSPDGADREWVRARLAVAIRAATRPLHPGPPHTPRGAAQALARR